MPYRDLRDFMDQLEKLGELKRVREPVSPRLEMTELCDRVLKSGGPALLFEQPAYDRPAAVPAVPVLANLFGTPRRVALAMGASAADDPRTALREIGTLLSFLKEPDPPKGLRDALARWLPIIGQVLHMPPRELSSAPCRDVAWESADLDLARLPIQTCWPGDAGPLVTWGLVVTRGPQGVPGARARQNLGIYRMQVLEPASGKRRTRLIMRWLAHRGGALDYQDHCRAFPDRPFPVAVALGADPATLLAAVTPIPDTLSEYQFAGLLRGARTELVRSVGDLQVPASSEIVLEGAIHPGDTALEGPFGDHTGYYNEQERFPVFTVERITLRRDAIYHSTYTGKPPDEPAVLGVALNEVFVPILQRQFPEIADFYLPPEGCSYRLAVVSIRKQFPGHPKRVMFGLWSFLRQFMYTKLIIVTDEDVNVRDWKEVVWALTTRVDAGRDCTVIENTPIDYLDFASPAPGLGAKMGIDATHKWPAETTRVWGRPITMEPAVKARVDELWRKLEL